MHQENFECLQKMLSDYTPMLSFFHGKEEYLKHITPEALLTDLGIDSLDRINLQTDMQDTFDIAFSSEEMDACLTVGDLSRLIDRKMYPTAV